MRMRSFFTLLDFSLPFPLEPDRSSCVLARYRFLSSLLGSFAVAFISCCSVCRLTLLPLPKKFEGGHFRNFEISFAVLWAQAEHDCSARRVLETPALRQFYLDAVGASR